MSEQLIEIKNVSFRTKDLQILKGVNLEINKGEFIYLIGKTGSGKSSLLKLLYADNKLTEGDIKFKEFSLNKLKRRKIPKLRRELGVIFQDFQLLPDRNVEDNLKFTMKATGWKKKLEIQNRIKEVLKMVELEDMNKKYPHQLSGGEQQRVSIARALVNNPELIIADEPTGNLDPETTDGIMQLLNDIKSEGTTVVMATHDYRLLDKYPGRVISCVKGKFEEKLEL